MNRKPTAIVVLAFATALATSCSRREPAIPSVTAAAVPRAATALPATAPPNANPKAPTGGTLGERLAAEIAARPPIGLHVGDVTAALRSAGVTVGPLTQVLGRTVGARYCASTATSAGVGVAVCEFADDAEAARGLDYSHRQFDRLVPGRTLLRNRGTVLTLTPGDASAEAAAEATRAAAVFASL